MSEQYSESKEKNCELQNSSQENTEVETRNVYFFKALA